MQTTKNLGLRKPESSDPANISDINYNSDLIDSAVTGLYKKWYYEATISSGYDDEYVVVIPNYSRFAEITIMFSHIEDLYGKVEKWVSRRSDNYYTNAMLSRVEGGGYSGFTVQGIRVGWLKLHLTTATGTSLSHVLSVMVTYYD